MELSEFDLITRIQAQALAGIPPGITGIGDDAAIIPFTNPTQLLVSTDLLIEDIHFKRDLTPPFELGRKSLRVNLSDIAAMGGKPTCFFVGIALPPAINWEYVQKFYAGLTRDAHDYQVALLGGDTSAAPERIAISITILGQMPAGCQPIRRQGTKPGDGIFVTGSIGDSALGFRILTAPKQVEAAYRNHTDFLVQRHNLPTPRVNEGLILSQHQLASAMIDISDGLIGDLYHLIENTPYGAQIDPDSLPLSPAYRAINGHYDQDPIDSALYGGEDYELLFTVPAHKLPLLPSLTPHFSAGITRIGTITAEAGRISLADNHGTRYLDRLSGYRHFDTV
jgi:thiamine-monophosphate kinase